MSSPQNSFQSVGVTQIAIGSSWITQLSPAPGISGLGVGAWFFQLTTGNSLEIVGYGCSVLGTSFQGGSLRGTGFLVGTSQIVSVEGNPYMYLCATGASGCVIQMVYGFV